METTVILLFALTLIGCLAADLPILLALAVGYILFFIYGLLRHYSWKTLLRMSWSGIMTIKNVLITFMLIGMLTAAWRAAGTIPMIICSFTDLIRPSVFLLMAFLMNCIISFLTGTSFGTAATMGVITMTMSAALGLSPLLTGGAVMSGIFFGDRCSPVSSSAMLVCELTQTNIYQNIRKMTVDAAVPFLITCLFYLLLGFSQRSSGAQTNVQEIFEAGFIRHWTAWIPALIILLFSLFRIKVRQTLLASICVAGLVCLLIQHLTLPELLKTLLLGFSASDPQIQSMLGGGGIQSMLRVSAIVCLSSSYAGIFDGTGLLNGMTGQVERLGRKTTGFTAIAVTAVVTCMIACNQTLAIMLTHQLCKNMEPEPETMALSLEDSAVVIAPLIPWSIAGAVPLSTIGAPGASLLAAFYLYLVPLWSIAKSIYLRQRLGSRFKSGE